MKTSIAIIDNYFPSNLVLDVAETWPGLHWGGWNVNYNQPHQKKRVCNDWSAMSRCQIALLHRMMAIRTKHLGLGKLIPDMSLWGAGLNDMSNGDFVNLHLDADTHAVNGMKRLLNGILFINPTWENSWGGTLDIWNKSRQNLLVTICPAFNRLLLFAPNDHSWHRVRKVECPEGIRRMTISCWWYGMPDSESKRTKAEFQI